MKALRQKLGIPGAALTVLAVTGLLAAELAHAARSKYSRSRRRGYTRQRLLSINLDPQESLNTSFRVAAREGRIDNMKTFVARGADVNSVSDEGKTALIYAARRCQIKSVRHLLGLKVNVNAKDITGRTALIYATRAMCVPVVRLLLNSTKIDPLIRDKSGRVASDYAGLSTEIVDLFKLKASSSKSG